MPYAIVNGHRIHFLDTQQLGYDIDNDKLPIVMVHGLGGSENFYLPVIPQLHGHRCVAISTYGAGLSKSHGEPLTLEELGEDVASLMDHLNISKAVVVGHSMGGTMVCSMALAHPEKVAGLVCLGPVNPAGAKLAEVFTSRIETVMKDGMEPLADAIPQSATNMKSTPLQRAMIRELIIGQDPKSYTSHCRVIVEMSDPGFLSIKAPVWILAGDEDKSAPLESCQFIHQQLGSQKKELIVLTGVGHWHCIEDAERVGSLIRTLATTLGAEVLRED